MSSTATTRTTPTSSNTVSSEAARLRNWKHLSDYELHHSDTSTSPFKAGGPAQDPLPQQPTPISSLQLALHNPDYWPNNHRRIPRYRPINRDLDQSQRRIYQNTSERVFLTMMFTGVQMNATVNRFWNSTLGRLNRSWFEYKIGGEW